jgi:hypothetical protein
LLICSSAYSQASDKGGISGRVFDANGKAAFQMEVRVMKADAVEANPESIFAEDRIFSYVEQSGSYVLEGLQPGRYILAVNADFRFPYQVTYYPGVQDVAQATVITVEGNQQLQNLDVELNRPSLSGRVIKGVALWANGSPAIDARVNLLVAKYPWIAPSSIGTDKEGRFTLYGYEGIKYLIHAWAYSKNKEEMHAEPLEVSPMDGMKPVRLALNASGKGFPSRKTER